ncbi:endonuclease MutS2 [Longibacter salinarum]|uniref:Endonuclease MutS2 n=1 Tax=Longibacter salinarum TaxID=1850348 RepID=A0A2A8D0P2_9BACT|nr:Smr/MutS family protein [Longibacter salinarum]PEN14532.1 endonuclease MutS2 [Longibacter salinarum]
METYPASIEEKLGFDILRQRLSDRMMSPLGQERLDRMQPARTMGWLEDELVRVEELQAAFQYDENVPLNHIFDLRQVMKRAAPEDAYVDPEDLRRVRLVLITLRRLKSYFDRRRSDYPSLASAVERITPLKDVETHISTVIAEEGGVRDDASEELGRLRRQIKKRRNELRGALDSALREAMNQGWATEEQATIRGGRMVIPVRAEAKRKVDGFIHDTSATGQTVYIEPSACMRLNNEVNELKSDERREVQRILRKVTSHLSRHSQEMRHNLKALAQFDLLQAKAGLANHLEAVVPKLNDDGIIDVKDGRNPVLQLHFEAEKKGQGASNPVVADDEDGPREVVPLDLRLGDEFNTLVITGPNAGGKTVAMKTVGLLSLMLAYGMPIPVAPHSRFSLFHQLMVDIGDEQSIEEDLSTFSSHVSNLRHMLKNAGSNTLVLIDEAGTGTDPDEGGALAQAVLEHLTSVEASTIVTTHHGTLKVYAHEADRVENGSMEFDQNTLRPTYRYQQGVPGSSYAFEIAQRMGLETRVLDRARDLAGEQKTAMENLITTFERRNQELEETLDKAKSEKRNAEKEKERFEQKWRKIEKERDSFRQQALEEAERIVQDANARIEQTIKEIKESEAEREATKDAREKLEAYKKDLREDVDEARGASEKPSEKPSKSDRSSATRPTSGDGASRSSTPKEKGGPIREGDRVVLDNGSTTMDVQEVEDDEAVVVMGAMHMRVDLDRLTKVGGPRKEPETGYGADISMTALEASPTIDVRGERVEQARQRIQHFIDDAIAAGLNTVEILHGKGTGALRQAIHDDLRSRSDVKDVRKAPIEQGGAGVTLADLA